MFINEGWSKYILRRSMEDVLPTEIAWRKDKVGYEPPQTDWFSQPQYISIFSEAQEYLMAEKVINRPNSHYLWQHLMISKLLKTGAL